MNKELQRLIKRRHELIRELDNLDDQINACRYGKKYQKYKIEVEQKRLV